MYPKMLDFNPVTMATFTMTLSRTCVCPLVCTNTYLFITFRVKVITVDISKAFSSNALNFCIETPNRCENINRELKVYNATGSTTRFEFQLENEP